MSGGRGEYAGKIFGTVLLSIKINSVRIVHHDYERLIEKSVLRICLR